MLGVFSHRCYVTHGGHSRRHSLHVGKSPVVGEHFPEKYYIMDAVQAPLVAYCSWSWGHQLLVLRMVLRKTTTSELKRVAE